jgi:hypothetical protein
MRPGAPVAENRRSLHRGSAAAGVVMTSIRATQQGNALDMIGLKQHLIS